MTTTNTQTKGKIPSQTSAELSSKRSKRNLQLPAIAMAAVAICAASCSDSAGGDEETITEYKTEQPVLRFETLPDGTQKISEEHVEADLPDPVMRLVEKDQNGTRWMKISHEPVPFADGTKDTTGLLREYAYVNLDSNQVLSQERFDSAALHLTASSDTVYWHAASPYSFDGFWSKDPEMNKDEAMMIHQQNITLFTSAPVQDTAKHDTTAHGVSGDWSTDSVQSNPVHTRSGSGGHYVFFRSYYPYAYHNSLSSPLANNSPATSTNRFSSPISTKNRFTTTNMFRNKLSMTQRISPKNFHFSTRMRTAPVRGVFSSRGPSFGT